MMIIRNNLEKDQIDVLHISPRSNTVNSDYNNNYILLLLFPPLWFIMEHIFNWTSGRYFINNNRNGKDCLPFSLYCWLNSVQDPLS